jgi:hypothetical protein
MILAIFLILMCITSLTLHEVMNVTVHNQYSDIELASPVYFCNCGTYNEYPIERTSNGITMKIGFRFGLDKLPGGILMYELQRKGNTKSDHRSRGNAKSLRPPRTDITSTNAVEDTSKMM